MLGGMKYLLVLLMLVSLVDGLLISEIMYDSLGSDEGNEWIELYNDNESLDISDLRLLENDITTCDKLHHKLDKNNHLLLDLQFDEYDDQFIKNFFANLTSRRNLEQSNILHSSHNAASNTSSTHSAASVASINIHQSHDRELLIKFYNENSGVHWDDHLNWCTHASLSLWYGITVDAHTDHVTKICLPNNHITGNLLDLYYYYLYSNY